MTSTLLRRVSIIVCLCFGAAAALLAGLPTLTTHLLACRLVGRGRVTDGRLLRLLRRRGIEEHPAGLDFASPDTEYVALWCPIAPGEEVIFCQVSGKSRLRRWTGDMSYTFVFDMSGSVLLQSYDFTRVGLTGLDGVDAGFVDIDCDGVLEKVMFAPTVAETRDMPALRFDRKIEVYRFVGGSAVCIFRALYRSWPGPHVMVHAGIVHDPVPSRRRIELHTGVGGPGKILATFKWNESLGRLGGPRGGPGREWVLDHSLAVPRSGWSPRAARVRLLRALLLALLVSLVAIAAALSARAGCCGESGRTGGVEALRHACLLAAVSAATFCAFSVVIIARTG